MATTTRSFRVEVHEDADNEHPSTQQQQASSTHDENHRLTTKLPVRNGMKMGSKPAGGSHIIGKKFDHQTTSKTTTLTSSSCSSLSTLPAAKRALGDITNAVRNPSGATGNQSSSSILAGQHQQLKGTKIRRTGSTKPPTMAARKVKNNNNTQVHQAVSNSAVTDHNDDVDEDGSPMDSSATAPRNNRGGLDRLAKRANAAAIASGPSESSYRFDMQKNNIQTVDKTELELVDSAVHVDNQKKVSADGSIGELLTLNDKLLSNVTEDEYADIDVEYTPCGQTKIPPTVINIDLDDMNHRCMESAYASTIHKGFVDKEELFMVASDYIATQHDITSKMRSILIDWLVDVHCKFKLRCETLFLTVSIIDRYLAVVPVGRRKLQLVGVTAMLIASKYEDIYAPLIKDFVYISDKAYTKKEIINMEASILNCLNFDITLPYSLTFMYRYVKAFNQSCIPEHVLASASSKEGLVNLHVYLAKYLIELSLLWCNLLVYRPSVIAAAAVMLASKYIYNGVEADAQVRIEWNDTLRFYSGNEYTQEDLYECMRELDTLLQHEIDPANANKLTAVKRKFSSNRYCQISTRIVSVIQHQMAAQQQQQQPANNNNGMDICGSSD